MCQELRHNEIHDSAEHQELRRHKMEGPERGCTKEGEPSFEEGSLLNGDERKSTKRTFYLGGSTWLEDKEIINDK